MHGRAWLRLDWNRIGLVWLRSDWVGWNWIVWSDQS